MRIRPAKPQDTPNLTQLIAEFRLSLAELRGKDWPAGPERCSGGACGVPAQRFSDLRG